MLGRLRTAVDSRRRASAEESGAVPAPRIVLGVTTDTSLILLRGFPQYLASRGWDVHVVSAPGRRLAYLSREPGITTHALPMSRNPHPVRDAVSLVRWIALLRLIRPSIVSVGTPKAGLLGCLAAALTSVPRRVYTLRGLRSETTGGLTRLILNTAERMACASAHRVICVSPSLRSVAQTAGLAAPDKLVVLGPGSSNGVDVTTPLLDSRDRAALRAQHLPYGTRPVIGFVGRVTADKGLQTLADAIRIVREAGYHGGCLVIGGDDAKTSSDLRDRLNASGWDVAHLGHVDNVSEVIQAADMLCLPSLREGFPNVVLEAAVARVACIGSNATGVVDSIIDGETGLIFKKSDATSLADRIRMVCDEPELAVRLGEQARVNAIRHYGREVIWAIHHDFYSRLLHR